MSKIVNSSAGNSAFDTAGSAIVSTTQPSNNRASTIGGISSSSNGTSRQSAVTGETIRSVTYSGIAQAINADTRALDSISVTATAEITLTTALPSYVKAGDYFLTNKGFMVKIISITNSTTFVAQVNENGSNAQFGTTFYFFNQKNVSKLQENPIIMSWSTKIAGNTNSAISSGATEPNRSRNEFEAIRSTRTATAIRAGYWHEYSGTWTTAPTTANDTSIVGADTSASGNGQITYGGVVPTPVNTSL